MESGRVKKQRSKVNRACDNCRRRKIKCTGKFPCSNCEAYQCQCVYSSGQFPANNSTRGQHSGPTERPFPPSENGVVNMSSLRPSSRTDRSCPKISSDNYHFESNRCVHTQKPSNSPTLDLNALPLIELNTDEKGLYKSDVEFQKQLLNLQQALKHLNAIPNRSEHVAEVIHSINTQVDNLIRDWEPEYDVKEYGKYLKNGSEGVKSIETHLMQNKYTDQVTLTAFATWTDNNKAEKGNLPGSSFLLNQPLVDDVFGLYSPLQAMSLRGIGHLFQRCIKKATSSEEIVQVKENLYLLLRFFDICMDQFNQSCVSIANPLESYLQRKNALALSPNTTSSVSSRNSANNKDLVRVLINRLPQPFVQNVTSVSNKQLLDTMQDDFDMFSLVLKMYDDHKKGFESLMIKITANPDDSVMITPRLSTADIQDFICYCEEEELLLALCYSYYNSTLYHFDEFSRSLEYFELLLSLLDKQHWLEEEYGFHKVLDVAINYAVGMGLSRWEFYVGLDEETAERRRECWWKLYCIEKQYTFLTGYLSSIFDSKMNCLLPKVFRDAGFSDHRDFVSKVHLVDETSVFDAMSPTDLAFYGECAICQVTSNFYWDTLYNERFTSIKNSAKPPYVRYCLLEEVLRNIDLLKLKLDAIRKQTKKLSRIAYSNDSITDDTASKQAKALAVRHVLLQGCLLFYVSSALSNLVARLQVHPNQANVKASEIRYSGILHQEFIQMTKLLLSLDNDYSVSRAFVMYGHVYLMVVTCSFSGCCIEPAVDEVVMSLRLVRRLRDVYIYRENDDNEIVRGSKVYNDFRRLGSFVSVITNSLLQSFMLHNDLTKDELIKTFASAAPDVSDLLPLILNPKSEIYRHLMEPVQESGVHLNVKKMLGKIQKYPIQRRGYPRTAVQFTSPSSKNPRHLNPYSSPQQDVALPQSSLNSSNNLAPSVKNLTNPMVMPVDGFLTPGNSDPMAESQDPNLRQEKPTHVPSISNEDSNKFNLGTLDEFVHKGDLNDLYSTLWSDLYSDELGQSLSAFSNNYTSGFDTTRN
ncbi:PDR3 (YBL005W) and PDR1 (YGL013C) [Zygosaccharomyces parabailii]|nr:PDR3 (YBL005W) and PDR1 (YGL013C) [Zygosaccharomyces parabailii]